MSTQYANILDGNDFCTTIVLHTVIKLRQLLTKSQIRLQNHIFVWILGGLSIGLKQFKRITKSGRIIEDPIKIIDNTY